MSFFRAAASAPDRHPSPLFLVIQQPRLFVSDASSCGKLPLFANRVLRLSKDRAAHFSLFLSYAWSPFVRLILRDCFDDNPCPYGGSRPYFLNGFFLPRGAFEFVAELKVFIFGFIWNLSASTVDEKTPPRPGSCSP